jgi:putative endonuclease
MFFVYIVYSTSLDRYYVGYTQDLAKRLNDHNSGISAYTARSKDWQLKWHMSFQTRELAMQKERQIKAKKSRKYIEWLIMQF